MHIVLRKAPMVPLVATAILCIPVLAVFLSPDQVVARAWSAHAERAVGIGLALAAVICFFKRFEILHDGSSPEDSRQGKVLWIWFLPLVPILIHQCWYAFGAYQSLYLADTDFTNISVALNDRSRGGALGTPYLATGLRDSYLGHHFSPALYFLTPVYAVMRIADMAGFRPTHFAYAAALWMSLATGLTITVALIRRMFQAHSPFVGLVACLLPLVCVPVWRLSQSFHFELLVLPAAAMTFLGIRGRPGLFWPGIILWLLIKEDMAVYVFCFGIWMVTEASIRRRGFAVILAAMLWAGIAHVARGWIAGGHTPDWGAYWADQWNSSRQLWPSVLMLASVGFLPVFAPRFFILALAPILGLHVLSYHPWHQAFTGHYGYSVLPALLIGSLLGLERIAALRGRWPAVTALALLAVAYSAAANEKESPAGRFVKDPRADILDSIVKLVPPRSCVQAHRRFSAHVPLDVSVFPLIGAAGNPSREKILPVSLPKKDDVCRQWYVLVDWNEPQPPYYLESDLTSLRQTVEGSYRLVRQEKGVSLYSLR